MKADGLRALTDRREIEESLHRFAWMLDRAPAAWPVKLHFISNPQLELDGDSARSRCYCHAPMGRTQPGGAQEVITNAGFHEDQFVRTARGSCLAARVCHQTLRLGSLPAGYVIPQ